jgi:hypothetical protein
MASASLAVITRHGARMRNSARSGLRSNAPHGRDPYPMLAASPTAPQGVKTRYDAARAAHRVPRREVGRSLLCRQQVIEC